jgi:hypothetical protein
VIALALAASLAALPADGPLACGGAPQARTVTGSIASLVSRPAPPRGAVLEARLAAEAGEVRVQLGDDGSAPLRELDLAVGDAVAVTGHEVAQGGGTVLVAELVRRGALEVRLPAAPPAPGATCPIRRPARSTRD